jgi:TetR/AcrR family transcriptional repressor of nem operon
MRARADTKSLLLEQGLQLFAHKGFNNTGLQEILKTSGIPKGSFYHFFESKEAFGVEVVERYAERAHAQCEEILKDAAQSPLERLQRFFAMQMEVGGGSDGLRGCLMGNMTQEMGHLCEAFDRCLEKHWSRTRDLLADCIEEAIERGEVKRSTSPSMLADFLLNSWQGALMRLKVSGNDLPLRCFRETVFQHLLVN